MKDGWVDGWMDGVEDELIDRVSDESKAYDPQTNCFLSLGWLFSLSRGRMSQNGALC